MQILVVIIQSAWMPVCLRTYSKCQLEMNLFRMVNDSLRFIAHKSLYLFFFSFVLFESVNFLFFLLWLVSLLVISGALLIALTYMGEDIIDCLTNQHIVMDLSCQCNVLNILLLHNILQSTMSTCQLSRKR